MLSGKRKRPSAKTSWLLKGTELEGKIPEKKEGKSEFALLPSGMRFSNTERKERRRYWGKKGTLF